MPNIESLSASGSYHPTFQHSPLDYNQPAIRVLRIRPDLSEEGYLQCSLTSTTTKDHYTCLSYTWGREDAVCPILLNWRLFLVRRNLINFLGVARKKYPGQALWIDAICIDQRSVIERNHQVAQMGAIYTAAEHVIIWLGNSRPIARFFEVWRQCNMIKSTCNWWIEVAKSLEEVELGWHLLTQHAYWTRAWITQEIARAKSLFVLAMDVELDRSLLKYIGKIPFHTYDGLDSRFTRHIDLARGRRPLHDSPLFSILQELPNQHCQIRRDRIYSLLALALEGANIPVDYEKTHLDIIADIMRACSESACICSFGLIQRVLGIPHTSDDLKAEFSEYFAEVTMRACQLVDLSDISSIPEYYRCHHCGWATYIKRTEVEVFRLHLICRRLPFGLCLETSWDSRSLQSHVLGQLTLDKGLPSALNETSGWFRIEIDAKLIGNEVWHTIRFSMSVLLSAWLDMLHPTIQSLTKWNGVDEDSCPGALRIKRGWSEESEYPPVSINQDPRDSIPRKVANAQPVGRRKWLRRSPLRTWPRYIFGIRRTSQVSVSTRYT